MHKAGLCGRRTRRAVFAAGLLLTLLVPAAAFAANTATFGSLAPARGSSSTARRPSISVRVHDRYGVHGTGSYSMTLDGKAVEPSLTYIVTGAWNPTHPDYSNLKLSHRVTADLSYGTHKVVVKVTDLRKRVSSTSWTFTVLAPPPPYHATFSSPVPARASSSSNARPAISLGVYDRYGVRGSGTCTMTIDGVAVDPTVSYNVSGVYTGFRVTYRPPVDLGVGSHTVAVGTRDLKGNASSYSWGFTILAPEPPYLATFSSLLPADGSSSTATRPRISISAYDKYGVRGVGNYSMTIDGGAVTPVLTYGASGVYTDLSLSHLPSADLSVGTHTVAVRITDLRGDISSRNWSFEVLAPPLPPSEMRVTGTTCPDCHVGYPLTHPMTACQSCHGASAPTKINGDPMTPYAPADLSAHTLSCATESCHGGGGAFPHVLDADCARCHTGLYEGIPAVHTQPIVSYHASTSAFCASEGCHSASLTMEHNRRDSAGAAMTCGTCHASSDPAVRVAIDAKSTACEGCHDFTSAVHPGTATVHATPAISCTAAGCHPGQATAVHNGTCAPCHAPGRTASTQCGTCHIAGQFHSGAPTTHAAGAVSCAVEGCHPNDVSAVHENGPKCVACHAAGKTPTTQCGTVGCHPAGKSPAHDGTAIAHTVVASSCVTSVCHATSVVTVHASGPGCAACHSAGAVPSTTCGNVGCHPGGTLAQHPQTAGKHTTADSCGSGDSGACHASDVTVIHVKDGVQRCSACHAVGVTPSTDCSTCHHDKHLDVSAPHAATYPCAAPQCHASGVTEIHKGKCAACHAAGKTASTACATCHSEAHLIEPAAHTTSSDCITSGCHDTNVAEAHHGKCRACHFTGKPMTVRCLDCHAGHDHNVTETTGTVTINGTSYGTHGCSECHGSTDLVILHGATANCVLCHPSPAKSAKPWTKTCAQGDCHAGASTVPMHGRIDTGHIATATPTCTRAGCHTGGSDVAAIHAPKLGCATCHGPDKVPTKDCSTQGCHPDGAPSSHDSHPSTVTSGTIVIGSVDYGTHTCSECHSTVELQAVHGGPASCSKCHPGPADSAKPWSGGCQQGDCHKAGTALALHGSIDALHASGTVPSCIASNCHSGGTNVVVIHRAEGCATCHGPGRPTTLTCATATCHGSADTHPASDPHPKMAAGHTTGLPGTCVQVGCHAADLPALHAAKSACATCHGDGKTPTKVCATAGCHPYAVSSATLHPAYVSGHSASEGACTSSSCHGANVTLIHVKDGVERCVACHASGKPALNTHCATIGCHPTTPATHASHPVTPADATMTISGTEYGSHACSECHVPLDLIDLHDSACTSCHPNPATGLTIDGGCVQGGCHQDSTALEMHGTIDASHTVSPAPTCTSGGSCHSGGSSVAAIHSFDMLAGTGFVARTGNGCSICHGAGRTPTLDCWTTGCHAGAGDAHPHAATPASETITISGVSYGEHACSECHVSLDLKTIHGGDSSCTTCHPGPRSTITTWAGGCVQGGCHTVSSTKPMHASIDSSHTVAATGCSVAGCHPTSIAAIHGRTRCVACHASGKPALTSDCAVCHPTKNLAAHIAIHDYCSNCHSSHNSAWGTSAGSIPGAHPCADCHPSPGTPGARQSGQPHDYYGGCPNCHY